MTGEDEWWVSVREEKLIREEAREDPWLTSVRVNEHEAVMQLSCKAEDILSMNIKGLHILKERFEL